jgi:transposase
MSKYSTVIGIDLGDRYNHYCMMSQQDGAIVSDGRVKCTEDDMRTFFSGQKPALVAIEAGTHSPWVSRLAEEAGHEVIVANPRKVRAIYDNERKCDKIDAEMLARIARMDPELLKPVKHRGKQAQADLAVLRTRDAAVATRTKLINHIRGTVKSFGARLPKCGAEAFHKQTLEAIPVELLPALKPLYLLVEQLTQIINDYEHYCERRIEEEYAETDVLKTAPGVGTITGLAYILTLEHPDRFKNSRSVAPFVGFVPRRDQSGDTDRSGRISKTGDAFLRRLLVGSAQYILGPFGKPSQLRDWGLKLASSGGKYAKRRAVVAVARKLAIILHRLWSTGMVWEDYPGNKTEDTLAAQVSP